MAAEIQKPIVPTRLYRYRSLTKKRDSFANEIDSIKKGYIYCAPFTSMNDPMEGFYRPSRALTGRPSYKKAYREITDLKSQIGIACFTESRNEILMWAHYADNCSGICLQYSSEELIEGLPATTRLIRLSYADSPPIVISKETENISETVHRILSHKNSDWAYEREWRVLGEVGTNRINGNWLKGIYFGSRINNDHRSKLLRIMNKLKVAAYSMKINGYHYSWEPGNEFARNNAKKSNMHPYSGFLSEADA